MVDRRIDGRPAVYTGAPVVINEERIPYAAPYLIPADGATNETDPRICVVCGQCRMFTRITDPQKFDKKMFGDTCRACKEGVSRRPTAPKGTQTKKRSHKTKDNVPF